MTTTHPRWVEPLLFLLAIYAKPHLGDCHSGNKLQMSSGRASTLTTFSLGGGLKGLISE